MPSLQRSISLRGPRFYEDGPKLMFVNHIDGSTRDGPRPATSEDKREHAEALKRFKAGESDEAFAPVMKFETPAEFETTADA